VTEPSATPVTIPVPLDTVAFAVLDDDHVANVVTFCVLPSDIVAVAVNCDVPPFVGADPVTLIDETLAEGAVEELHPTTNAASPATITTEVNHRAMKFLLCDAADIAILRTLTIEVLAWSVCAVLNT
jgi:hypothetical protein